MKTTQPVLIENLESQSIHNKFVENEKKNSCFQNDTKWTFCFLSYIVVISTAAIHYVVVVEMTLLLIQVSGDMVLSWAYSIPFFRLHK
jgi:hypothetical protein